MSKALEKQKAIKLRRQGNSIKDIARTLQVSRSSVSVWCQEVELTESQKRKLKVKQIAAGSAGRQKGAEVNREKRMKAIYDAKLLAESRIEEISKTNLFYLGLGIYWGEGIKSRSGPTAIVNSDARLLKVMIKWLDACLGVKKTELRPYIYISSQHRNRERVILDHWIKLLEIPAVQFKSPIYLEQRTQKFYDNHDTYFGVVALRVSKSTNLKYQILALLEAVSKRLD